MDHLLGPPLLTLQIYMKITFEDPVNVQEDHLCWRYIDSFHGRLVVEGLQIPICRFRCVSVPIVCRSERTDLTWLGIPLSLLVEYVTFGLLNFELPSRSKSFSRVYFSIDSTKNRFPGQPSLDQYVVNYSRTYSRRPKKSSVKEHVSRRKFIRLFSSTGTHTNTYFSSATHYTDYDMTGHMYRKDRLWDHFNHLYPNQFR